MSGVSSYAISVEEYLARQERARRATAERGLDALLAVSRSGGGHDRAADCLWLSGAATPQPFVPDLASHWRAAGHVAVAITLEGPTIAIVDSELRQWEPIADEIVVAEDLIAAAGDALLAAAASRSLRVGVLGTDVLSAQWWGAL